MSEFEKEMEELESLLQDNDYELLLSKLKDNFGIDIQGLEDDLDENSGKVVVKYTSENDLELKYNYSSDSGFDLYSTEEITIPAFGRDLIPTGIRFDIPEDFEIQIRSKSGLAIKQGLMVLNSPGTVDQGYTGEVKVIIFNVNPEPFTITKGMKIAQAVVSRCTGGKWVNLIKINSINDKDRGDNGFGSTGLK
jgi:dUTP pyrophosphatase